MEESDRIWALERAIQPPSFGSIEEPGSELKRIGPAAKPTRSNCVKAVTAITLAAFLVFACFVAAYVGAESKHGNYQPTIELHDFLSYFEPGAAKTDDASMHCRLKYGLSTGDDVPRWDPDFMEVEGWDERGKAASPVFYEACYRAFRCCSTSSSSCATSHSIGAMCRSCLANHGPRIVKAPCEQWLDLCVPGGDTNEQCLATGGSGDADTGDLWDRADLLADNGVPSSDLPVWSLKWAPMKDGAKGIGTCWKQKTDKAPATNPDVQAFAKKCWEVFSYCHSQTKVCPRDEGQTVGHTSCKDCMIGGYDDFTSH